MIFHGCASWRLPKPLQPRFPGPGTHLARYAARLPAVEINSSFYQSHRRALYAKWAGEVPGEFRFAVKLPRWLTHHQRLRDTRGLAEFLDEIAGLGDRLGPLLIQLPPSLRFEREHVRDFLAALRADHDGAVVCEPRHESWFLGDADRLLAAHQVSRAAVDPPVADGAERPGGWHGRCYHRLHGSPRRFHSAYGSRFLGQLADTLRREADDSTEVWCVFNNTAGTAGLENALELGEHLAEA